MKTNILLCSVIVNTFFLLSCDSEKKKPIYYDTNVPNIEENEEHITRESIAEKQIQNAVAGTEYEVSFRADGGVKYVPVKINGIAFEMIFDTGCSATLISIAEANYLYQKGCLTEDDQYLGTVKSTIADGSIVENDVIVLSEVIIDNKIVCHDVVATVSNSLNAPLLLGNEILDRLAIITIDNSNSVLRFKLK